MVVASALGNGLERGGVIAVTALAAAVLLATPPRVRALAMVGALSLAPVLLAAEVWESPELRSLRDRPALAALVAVAACGALAGASMVASRPRLLAMAAIVALPFRLPITVGGNTVHLLVPLYFVIAAGALAYVLPRLRGTEVAPEGERAPIDWLLAGFIVLYAVQSTYSSDFSKALQQVVFFYVPFAVLFALLARVRWDSTLLRAALVTVVALGLLFCAVGFIELATRELLLNAKLSAANDYLPYFRVNSLFFDPNIYGRFLVTGILLLSALVAWTAERRRLALASAAIAVLWAGLFTTLSQSSLGALLVGLLVLAALRWNARLLVGVAVALVVLGAVAFAAFPGAFGLRSDDAASLRRATTGRSDLVRGGTRLFARRPFLGWGSGAFPREYRRRYSRGRVFNSHTIPVTVAAEQGIVGLIAYLALLVVAFRLLLRRARESPARAAVAACFAALVFHTFVYAAFLEDPTAWVLLAVGVALAPAVTHPARWPGRTRPA